MGTSGIFIAYIHTLCRVIALLSRAAVLAAVAFMVGCSDGNKAQKQVVAPWGVVNDTAAGDGMFDLEQIVAGGEMIMATLSGPESYYDYRGRHLGLNFLLCQKFADKIGVSLRVEVCHDTTEMVRKLLAGEADVAAYWLSPADVRMGNDTVGMLSFCGPKLDGKCVRWVVAADNASLRKALDDWFRPAMVAQARREEAFLLSSRSIRRHVYAPMQDRKKGIISRYDGLFAKYSQKIRWDWRLLAAQCYQESTFDPNAKSWAGACGLMQIMPATASHLGLPLGEIFVPEANIEAATRYLGELESKFGDIADRGERTNFMLASYNGGYHHIRDAMRLATKHGKNPKSWSDVSRYVLLLSKPEYYRDPVVKYGYMRGSETVDYVARIRQRWQQYRGVKGLRGNASVLTPRKAGHRKAKFRLEADEG